MPKTKTRPDQAKLRLDLYEVLDRFQINAWDAVLIGDGSGSSFERGCGWAAYLWRRHAAMPMLFHGGFSHGTNNIAELMAYLHPLLWYLALPEVQRRPDRIVHIVTDSNYLVSTAKGEITAKRAHLPLWLAVRGAEHRGLSLLWHWLERDLSQHNHQADDISRQTRILLENFTEKLAASNH